MSKVAKIIFKSKIDNDDADFDVLYIVQSLYCNGQILKDFIIEEDNQKFQATVTLTSVDALDSKYWPIYIKEFVDKFIISYEIGKENLLYWKDNCNHEESTFYIMDFFYNSCCSPIKCGDCLEGVPFIKLPKLDENDRLEILRTEKLISSILEIIEYDKEYVEKQLDDLTSPLIKMILEVCNNVSLKVKKPVYYHFSIDENIKVCPKCGNKLDNIPIDITKYSEYSNIDKVCKKCNLAFSTIRK